MGSLALLRGHSSAILVKRASPAPAAGAALGQKCDSADDIGNVIAANVSEHKAKGIAKAITDKLRAKPEPAG